MDPYDAMKVLALLGDLDRRLTLVEKRFEAIDAYFKRMDTDMKTQEPPPAE